MRPIRIRYNGVPAFQDLIEMTDTEIKDYIGYCLAFKYANDGVNTGANVSLSSGTSIGTFTDTWRTESVNSPVAANATGATGSSVTTFRQDLTVVGTSPTTRIIGLSGTTLAEFTDAQYNTDILDACIGQMAAGNNVGTYQLKIATPTGGTWISRGSFTEKTDSASGGTSSTWTLWQRTAMTSPPTGASNRPLKWTGSVLQEMQDTEIQSAQFLFRNRIINNGPGQYRVQSANPAGTLGGTWVQQGDTITDRIQQYTVVNGYFNVTSTVVTGSGGSVSLWLRTA